MHPFEQLPVALGAVGIHWFGQNSFALKDAARTVVLVDPYFPHERPAEKFIHDQPPLTEADLKTDFVVLTHDHSDHTCLESLRRIHAAHPHARYVGPVESIERIRAAGVPEALLTPVAAGETVELGSMSAGVVWSKPPEGVPADGIDPPGVQHLGYVFRAGSVRVYVTGDLINTFGNHEELLQSVAALEPDIALLTCHPTEGEFPYFEGAVKIARRLELKAIVPAHYDCFAKRTYDPHDFEAQFAGEPARVILVPYNGSVVYPDA